MVIHSVILHHRYLLQIPKRAMLHIARRYNKALPVHHSSSLRISGDVDDGNSDGVNLSTSSTPRMIGLCKVLRHRSAP